MVVTCDNMGTYMASCVPIHCACSTLRLLQIRFIAEVRRSLVYNVHVYVLIRADISAAWPGSILQTFISLTCRRASFERWTLRKHIAVRSKLNCGS
jgi:hypothetical protein